MGADTIVAGYFEAGAYRPVTFAAYMQLILDNPNGTAPAYLKLIEGFAGVRLITPLVDGYPTFAYPNFRTSEQMAEIRRREL